MPYMYPLYVWLSLIVELGLPYMLPYICMPHMYALYVCWLSLIVELGFALYVCLMYALYVCLICMPYMYGLV